MNSHERLDRRLRGERVDRPPNLDIMMTFAAHHIGAPLSAYYREADVLVRANLAVLEAFDLDVVQTISDPYRETADIAVASGWSEPIHFPEDDLPVLRRAPLEDPRDLGRLRPPPPEGGRRMGDRLAATRALREAVGDDVPVMGWVEGALAEAADLRGVSRLLMDLYDRPEWVRDLLEWCVEVEAAFAVAQVRAGATIIGLGDSVASQISPAAYREIGLPYEKRIFQAVHGAGALARLHICGDTSRILADMAVTGADIIDLDWMVDMADAARAFGTRAAPCGNADPVAVFLQGTPEDIRREVIGCLRRGGPRSISAAGCEIPDGTPHANLRAQVDALRRYGEEPC